MCALSREDDDIAAVLSTKNSMHTGYRLAWIRHQLEDALVCLSHVPSEVNLADILTISLKCDPLKELRAKILRPEGA